MALQCTTIDCVRGTKQELPWVSAAVAGGEVLIGEGCRVVTSLVAPSLAVLVDAPACM
jgi:hypothetical protein